MRSLGHSFGGSGAHRNLKTPHQVQRFERVTDFSGAEHGETAQRYELPTELANQHVRTLFAERKHAQDPPVDQGQPQARPGHFGDAGWRYDETRLGARYEEASTLGFDDRTTEPVTTHAACRRTSREFKNW